ncbi:uncharacterized protein [Nicotiana sylvestris]|uniref:uncharacterized protein n=1 Tax=Nicotiana sylvestris TaxID=4096 RepID=UPI00388C8A7B
MTNTKVIPWNYNKTVMTYKGKEIVKETDKIGGLTRSGRFYSQEELRKAKQARESHLPVKEPIAEKEAEEFLKKMKMQDYSIIEQLRKTPAQLSLLSLLLHSEEHRRVLIKTLNEAYVSKKTTVNQLKMAKRLFEVNRITFSDDNLLEEGVGHNKALHLMVKCEEHYVKVVMIDGGSNVVVCPLSTLQQLNIDTNRIRTSNVSIKAFDCSRRDTIAEIELTMTIGPVDFNIVFQVLDMKTSYNFLLGRLWIHMARADKKGCVSIIYQAFEVIEVDQVEEGKPILHPRLSATSMIVASPMLRNGYESGKGLGSSLSGIVNPISPFTKKDTFGLGFKPASTDINRAKPRKKWLEFGLKEMFYEINMVQDDDGPSRASIQLIGPDTSLNNWEATPLPIRKESW